MKKHVPLTKEEIKQITEFMERYFHEYFVTGELKNDFPITFLGGSDENFVHVRASIVFAMKKDEKIANIIKEAVRCFDDTPDLQMMKASVDLKMTDDEDK